MNETEYDVALSFAGEQRDYVRSVYEELLRLGVKPYYDEAETVQTLGANLIDHFSEIFGGKARFCVMFISKEYVNKPWTNFERQFIEERQLYEQGYIIPIRFDNAELKGLPSTIGYVKANQYSPVEFAELISQKVKSPSSIPNTQKPKIIYEQPRIKPKSYNVYKERDRWLDSVLLELENRQTDERLDIAIIRTGIPGIRVLFDGELLWAINFKYAGHANDRGMSISTGSDTDLYNNSMNAYGDFEWSREKQQTVFAMHDLSFLIDSFMAEVQRYTDSEFVEAIWSVIVKKVEKADE